jgi:hypothetical protein
MLLKQRLGSLIRLGGENSLPVQMAQRCLIGDGDTHYSTVPCCPGQRSHRAPQMGGEIATVPENRSKMYCGDALGVFLVVGDRH